MSKPARRRQGGQASVEYVVVCLALVLALGLSMLTDESVLKQLIEAFRLAYKKISFALSFPY
ncbi:uncharacterized protein (UPF0333 family) [Paucibacter oligotrophus]|uniref:Uncharacterized protein (UPF0333 family) n=1 Tax=Roseateles oligotrophus TaxID=1769250 RepID=A0A840L8U5_9BURK|nr:hypothetical protein [Roseateles oligotrophus]MBB4842628.1 uncharacterized protein (UPF0333 family) [Roseateles oligotrophus]